MCFIYVLSHRQALLQLLIARPALPADWQRCGNDGVKLGHNLVSLHQASTAGAGIARCYTDKNFGLNLPLLFRLHDIWSVDYQEKY